MIREFSLKNAIGNTWNLNDLESFLTEPDGLGFEYDDALISEIYFLKSAVNLSHVEQSFYVIDNAPCGFVLSEVYFQKFFMCNN